MNCLSTMFQETEKHCNSLTGPREDVGADRKMSSLDAKTRMIGLQHRIPIKTHLLAFDKDLKSIISFTALAPDR